jgi:hypothetical protein
VTSPQFEAELGGMPKRMVRSMEGNVPNGRGIFVGSRGGTNVPFDAQRAAVAPCKRLTRGWQPFARRTLSWPERGEAPRLGCGEQSHEGI